MKEKIIDIIELISPEALKSSSIIALVTLFVMLGFVPFLLLAKFSIILAMIIGVPIAVFVVLLTVNGITVLNKRYEG